MILLTIFMNVCEYFDGDCPTLNTFRDFHCCYKYREGLIALETTFCRPDNKNP